MANGNITVGTMAIARVGRNAIEVEVIAEADGGAYLVCNRAGKEFTARRLEAKPVTADGAKNTSNEVVSLNPDLSAQPETSEADKTSSSVPESSRHEKKLSLLDAAAQTLKHSRSPMNTKEIVARIVESGIWTPTGAKTPEQSLYSAIFREIKEKENPRFRKSAEKKGSFEFNR